MLNLSKAVVIFFLFSFSHSLYAKNCIQAVDKVDLCTGDEVYVIHTDLERVAYEDDRISLDRKQYSDFNEDFVQSETASKVIAADNKSGYVKIKTANGDLAIISSSSIYQTSGCLEGKDKCVGDLINLSPNGELAKETAIKAINHKQGRVLYFVTTNSGETKIETLPINGLATKGCSRGLCIGDTGFLGLDKDRLRSSPEKFAIAYNNTEFPVTVVSIPDERGFLKVSYETENGKVNTSEYFTRFYKDSGCYAHYCVGAQTSDGKILGVSSRWFDSSDPGLIVSETTGEFSAVETYNLYSKAGCLSGFCTGDVIILTGNEELLEGEYTIEGVDTDGIGATIYGRFSDNRLTPGYSSGFRKFSPENIDKRLIKFKIKNSTYSDKARIDKDVVILDFFN